MNARLVKRSAFALVAVAALFTTSLAFQPAPPPLPFVPGIGHLPAGQTLNAVRYGYTATVGTFLIDTNTGKASRAVFRSVPVDKDGNLLGPISIYEKKMDFIAPATLYGRAGRLFRITWASPPAAGTMPEFVFICAYPWDGYDIYTYRSAQLHWREIGCFVRTPLDAGVTP